MNAWNTLLDESCSIIFTHFILLVSEHINVFKYVQRLRPVAGTKNTKIDELLILEGMGSHKNVLKEVYKKILGIFVVKLFILMY